MTVCYLPLKPLEDVLLHFVAAETVPIRIPIRPKKVIPAFIPYVSKWSVSKY